MKIIMEFTDADNYFLGNDDQGENNVLLVKKTHFNGF